MSDNTLQTLLSNYPESVQELTYAAQDLVAKLIPGLTIMPDTPAKVIGYGFSNKYSETICTTILSQKGIKIGFYKGTELPDPNGLLEGTGKVHKYVAIKSLQDIQSPALQQLIQAAYSAYLERKK